MSVLTIDSKQYAELLANVQPTVIRDAETNDRYLAALEALHGTQVPLSREEKELSDLLTLLIENFESEHYALKRATPIETLRELMDAQGLLQRDLVDIFGTESIVSEVLSGKRRLAKDHISRLAKRFHVSPELFFSLDY